MDKSSVRRGSNCLQKWNTNIAILAGDAMIIQAYKHLSDVDPKYISDIANVFNKTNLQVCEGQQYDLDYENEFSVRIEDYIEMIRLKTSVLLAASAKIEPLLEKQLLKSRIFYMTLRKFRVSFSTSRRLFRRIWRHKNIRENR